MTIHCNMCGDKVIIQFKYCHTHLYDGSKNICVVTSCNYEAINSRIVCQKHWKIWQSIGNRTKKAYAARVLFAYITAIESLQRINNDI